MTDLGYRSATDLVTAVKAKEVASRELLDHLLDRVATHNPGLNAVITLDAERARRRAAAADEAAARGEDLGPLHGLPMTVKDVFETEGLRSTSGAAELLDHVPDCDAGAVARLKAAGAIVFAKTNLPRYAGDLQTFNEPFGVTNNPWDRSRTAGGSSGGSAVALAAGLTPLELGSDIGGSIRNPSHFNGTVGHKPTFGVVPQSGYLSGPGGLRSLDVNVVGPMARTVADLELALEVLAGPEGPPARGWRLELPPPRRPAAGEHRIAAWLDDRALPVDPPVGDVLVAAASALRADGLTVDEGARPGLDLGELARLYERIMYPAMVAGTGVDDEGMALVAAIADSPEAPDEPLLVRGGRALGQRYVHWLYADERRQQVRDAWSAFFGDWDVLLCPVVPVAAFPHDVDSDPQGIMNRTVSVAGREVGHGELTHWCGVIGVSYLPSVVVPVGRTADGLPVGVQVVADFLEDRTALAVAERISRVLGGFEAPPGYAA